MFACNLLVGASWIGAIECETTLIYDPAGRRSGSILAACLIMTNQSLAGADASLSAGMGHIHNRSITRTFGACNGVT